MVIFLLHLKTSALSCRSILENPMSINVRVRHPIFIKPSSSHALAIYIAVIAATGLATWLLTYLCFRCTLQGVFFTGERLSASRRDCITAVGALLQVAVVGDEHKPIK